MTALLGCSIAALAVDQTPLPSRSYSVTVSVRRVTLVACALNVFVSQLSDVSSPTIPSPTFATAARRIRRRY
jgi:hypothetical protein